MLDFRAASSVFLVSLPTLFWQPLSVSAFEYRESMFVCQPTESVLHSNRRTFTQVIQCRLTLCLDPRSRSHSQHFLVSTFQFKRMLNKELSHFSESKSGNQISEYICSTFLGKIECQLPSTTSCFVHYRVSHLLVGLDWVDLYLCCSTIMPFCSAKSDDITSAPNRTTHRV